MLLLNFDCSIQKSEKVTEKQYCERARLQSRINIKIVKVERSNRCEILREGKNNNDPHPPALFLSHYYENNGSQLIEG